MGAKFKGSWPKKGQYNVAAEKNLIAGMTSAMHAAMEMAEREGVRRINTSGTGRTWAYPSPNGRAGSYGGRVDTGEMRDQFGSNVEEGAGSVEGKFGWLEGTPFYFLFQEYGFRHWITGELIEGMQALREADEEAWPFFVQEADKHIQEFVNAVFR